MCGGVGFDEVDMREIKFRYIVKDEFGELHTIIKTLGQIAHSATERNFSANNCEVVARDEWTGLLDANGREVYEGDVMARKDFYQGYQVLWSDSGGCWCLDSDRTRLHAGIIRKVNLAVIGNIYENPELVG